MKDGNPPDVSRLTSEPAVEDEVTKEACRKSSDARQAIVMMWSALSSSTEWWAEMAGKFQRSQIN